MPSNLKATLQNFTCTGLVGLCRRQTHDNITLSLKNGAIRAMGNKSHPNHGKLRIIIEPNLSTFYGHENITIDEDADPIHSQRGSTSNNRDRGDIAFIDTTNNQNSRIIDVTTIFPTPTNAQRNDPRKIKLTSSYSFANEAEKRKATKYGKRFSINENADGPQHPAMPAAKIDIYGALSRSVTQTLSLLSESWLCSNYVSIFQRYKTAKRLLVLASGFIISCQYLVFSVWFFPRK